MRMALTTLAMSAAPAGFAFITQHGWDLNLVNDAGEPARGWIDYPGHLWVPDANQGAIYSVDGVTIQFDRGTIWQRAIDGPLPGRRRR